MEFEQLIARSSAAPEFKESVRLVADHRDAPMVTLGRFAPRVKVARVLAQLLDSEPTLPIERVHIEGRSGCSDFRGVATVQAAGKDHVFEFAWDCQWRAEAEGFTDFFGFPDQIRAAHTFGWRCFKVWRLVPDGVSVANIFSATH